MEFPKDFIWEYAHFGFLIILYQDLKKYTLKCEKPIEFTVV